MLATSGINPQLALVVVSADSMLFTGTVITGPVGRLMSVPIGTVLGVATGLTQPHESPGTISDLLLGRACWLLRSRQSPYRCQPPSSLARGRPGLFRQSLCSANWWGKRREQLEQNP